MTYWVRHLSDRLVVHRMACRSALRGKGQVLRLDDIPTEAEDCRICGGRWKERS